LEELISHSATETASNPLLEVAMAIEDAVQNEDYFVSRKLRVNADLYDSFVCAAL
jgi:citrate synthase